MWTLSCSNTTPYIGRILSYFRELIRSSSLLQIDHVQHEGREESWFSAACAAGEDQNWDDMRLDVRRDGEWPEEEGDGEHQVQGHVRVRAWHAGRGLYRSVQVWEVRAAQDDVLPDADAERRRANDHLRFLLELHCSLEVLITISLIDIILSKGLPLILSCLQVDFLLLLIYLFPQLAHVSLIFRIHFELLVSISMHLLDLQYV